MLYLDRYNSYHLIESATLANISKLLDCLEQYESAKNVSEEAELSLLTLIASFAGVSEKLIKEETDDILTVIAAINFPQIEPEEKSKKSDEEKISLKEYHHHLLVDIINTEMANSLADALAIASAVPYLELKSHLDIRLKFLNRDAIAAERKKKAEEGEAKQLLSDISDGSFYEGFPHAS